MAPTPCSPAPISYEDLERRFDGPIPPRLLSGKTERQLMIDHHRAMIRFSAVRIADFTASLARLKAGPQAPGTDTWITRTIGIIADHAAEKARHEADLAALLEETLREEQKREEQSTGPLAAGHGAR